MGTSLENVDVSKFPNAGLLGGIAGVAGAAADMYNEEYKNAENDRRQQALLLKEQALAKFRSDLEVEQRSKLAEVADARTKAEEESTAALLKSGREKFDAARKNQPGGYDPNDPEGASRKTYDQLSAQEQFMTDADTLKNAGKLKEYDSMLARAKAVAPEKDSLKEVDPEKDLYDNHGKLIRKGTPKDEITWQHVGDTLFGFKKDAKGETYPAYQFKGDAKPSDLEKKADALVKTGKYKTTDDAIAALAAGEAKEGAGDDDYIKMLSKPATDKQGRPINDPLTGAQQILRSPTDETAFIKWAQKNDKPLNRKSAAEWIAADKPGISSAQKPGPVVEGKTKQPTVSNW